jgi:hypothetical protein
VPDLTITGHLETDHTIGPGGQLRNGCSLEVSHNLDQRLADAVAHAVEAIKDEQQRRLAADRSDVQVVTEVVEPETHTIDTNTASRLEVEDLATRATDVVDIVREQLARRASDLDLLTDSELTDVMRSMLLDHSMTAAVDAHAAGLEQQAVDERAAIERISEALTDRYPDLADHVADVVAGSVTADEACELALDILGCDASSIAELAARADDEALDEHVRQAAAFDACLAMTYADHLLAEQAHAARCALEADAQQLPVNSQEGKTVDALVAIGEQLVDQPAPVHEAVEAYYHVLAAGDSHVAARAVVDQLLAAQDQSLLDYLVTLREERRNDRLVERALSEDPDVRAHARRQIEQSGTELEGQRHRRISPLTDNCVDPGHLEFHLATAQAADAFNAALLQRQDVGAAVDLHAETRMRDIYTVLHLVGELRDQGRIAPDSPVTIAGAVYQLGKGSDLDDTNAAHRMPGQIYLGVDRDELVLKTADQREAYRLDSLLAYDSELQTLARFEAAVTTILPRYVNNADSAWEAAGLRDALSAAIDQLLDPKTTTTVTEAYETFRTNAAAALAAARIDNEAAYARLEAARAADTALSLIEQQQLRTIMVLDQYREILAVMDAQRAHDDLQAWIATIERNRQS